LGPRLNELPLQPLGHTHNFGPDAPSRGQGQTRRTYLSIYNSERRISAPNNAGI
jgi:hypothetical protein